jgi:hypothetical protein
MSWNNFCSCSRTIGYKNRADADACRSNCCIRGFASARRSVGKDRPHPERPGRDNVVAFSYSLLAVDKSSEDGACHSKQSSLRRFDLDQCAICGPVVGIVSRVLKPGMRLLRRLRPPNFWWLLLETCPPLVASRALVSRGIGRDACRRRSSAKQFAY